MNLRKIFLSVLLLWIFAAGTNLMAQGNTDPLPNNTANSSLEKMLRKIVEETVDAMRVKVISGELSLAQATIDSLQSSTTANGSKETTQLQVLAELQNRINMGGTQTYSLRRQDFTATLKAGGKSIAVTGLNGGTLSYLNFAYGWIINSTTGVKTYLTTAVDSVAGTSIRFPNATAFTATDVLGELVFVYPEKMSDKANDAQKNIEQAPLWARYQIDEIYDGTNLAAGTNYYPSSTGASMDGYKNLSFTGKLIDADNTTTITIEATNDEDAGSADWVQVYARDIKNNTTVNSIAAASTTTTFAIDLIDFNYSLFRVKVVTGDSTNTVIVKQRRSY